jgi:hypothetical protein
MSAASGVSSSFPLKIYTRVWANVEFGDVLMFFFLLVFVRQYFWIVGNDAAAWTLSLAVALLAWSFFVAAKPLPAATFGITFWLAVALPLFAVYSLRAAFPDHSFDVLSYHLLHSERSLRGPLFGAGDFFPTATPFNPAGDTLTGISRMIFGFRLGTVINLLVMIWVAQVADKILRPFVAGPWLRAGSVLVIVLAENLLFEISTYMVDLLALPLMLEATFLTLRTGEADNRRSPYPHIGLLLGLSTAFKISNLAVVIPLVAIGGYKLIRSEGGRPTQLVKTASISLSLFLAPMLPFTLYIFRLTGNPIFPIANSFFRSPYWPTHGGWDNRWGPQVWWETILWPILIWFKPERHSELAVYSGRMSLGFLAALAGLVIVWRRKQAWHICLILAASSLLWSVAGLGYSRYGLYQETFAGIATVVLAAALWQSSKSKLSIGMIGAVCLGVVLLAQTGLGFSYFLNREWGARTTLLKAPDLYAREMKFVLRDRSLSSFFDDRQRASLNQVGAWLETCPQSTGFEVLIKPHAPIIAVRQPEYFFTRESWRQFVRSVDSASDRKLFSLCLNDDAGKAKQVIAERGLEIGELTQIQLPFYSPFDRIGMTLIEVRRPQDPEALRQFESSWMKGAFPASDYREEIVALDPPTALRAGEKREIHFKVKNLGESTWPAVGTKDFRYQINMGDRWITAGTKIEDNRAVLSGDLGPGGETQMTLTVNAPGTPGDYTLEIDMVHEGVTWFSERGARPLRIGVRVTP